MSCRTQTRGWLTFVAAVVALSVCCSWSQPTTAQESANPAAGPTVKDEIALKQGQLADKYARLEELMIKMSSLEAANNPRRAALLQKAVQQSKERLTKAQLETVVKLLQENQLKRAIDGQSTAQTDLKALLDLLMTEGRDDKLKSEQQRIKEYLKEVERLIRLEKSLQGQTEGDADAKRLAEEQKNIAERTGDLAKKIKEQEEGKSGDQQDPNGDRSQSGDPMGDKGEQKPGDQKPGENKPGDMKPGDMPPGEKKPGEDQPGEKKPGDMKPGDDKPGDKKPDDKKPDDKKPGDMKPGDQKPDDKKPGEQQPGENQPSENQPGSESKSPPSQPMPPMPGQQGKNQPGGDSQPQDQQQPQQAQQDNPARQRLEQAQQAMKDAQRKLEEAKRKESLADQQKAREELEKAKAELEQILRQLREEEKERTLAMLEARFRKMLEMQLKVYEGTRRLDQVADDARNEEFVVQSGKLGFEERKIATEAEKALALLLEEGSSVAFPASVEQMKEDMEQVSRRLAEVKVDDITLGIEEDIIAALEELIEALQQAQRDQEEKKQQQQQQQQQNQQQQEDPLVDAIAELKMIRALQERVNKRTTRFARLLRDLDDPVGQAESAELAEAIQQLSGRQQEIRRITRDIVTGKNK